MDTHFKHYPGVFSDISFDRVKREIDVKFDTFTAIQDGREVVCQEPRGTAWFSKSGKTFTYSNKTMHPAPFNPLLTEMADRLKELVGVDYDSVLVNLYPHGKSGMRYHVDPLFDPNDPERQIWADDTSVISVGDTRKFIIRDIEDGSDRKYYRFNVEGGDMMRMYNRCQRLYQHTVKVEKAVESVGPRYSIVFKQSIN